MKISAYMMIEVVCKELDDANPFGTFLKCIQEAHIDAVALAVAPCQRR